MSKSTGRRSGRKAADRTPKPHADFPLTPHAADQPRPRGSPLAAALQTRGHSAHRHAQDRTA